MNFLILPGDKVLSRLSDCFISPSVSLRERPYRTDAAPSAISDVCRSRCASETAHDCIAATLQNTRPMLRPFSPTAHRRGAPTRSLFTSTWRTSFSGRRTYVLTRRTYVSDQRAHVLTLRTDPPDARTSVLVQSTCAPSLSRCSSDRGTRTSILRTENSTRLTLTSDHRSESLISIHEPSPYRRIVTTVHTPTQIK